MSLTNSQVDEIMRDYSRRQIINANKTKARYESAIAKVYEITGENLNDIRDEKISLHAAKLFADEETISKNDSLIDSLIAREKELLSRANISMDYLEPIYTCPMCKDTGYLSDGRKCPCFKKACIELLYKKSTNLNLAKDHTFDNFNCDLYPKTIDEKYGTSPYDNACNILKLGKTYVNTFDSKMMNIFLYGNVGTGKTFFADCIANALINTLHSVIYMSANNFFENMADNKFKRSTDEASLDDNAIYECDLLILDDLGTELTNSLTQTLLFTCINERLSRNKSTIITSNYDINHIRDLYSERIASRIRANYTTLPILGEDLRVHK